jgi:hypothetical protein
MPMRGTLAKRHQECTQQHHSSTTDAENPHLNRASRLAAVQNSFSFERSFDLGMAARATSLRVLTEAPVTTSAGSRGRLVEKGRSWRKRQRTRLNS